MKGSRRKNRRNLQSPVNESNEVSESGKNDAIDNATLIPGLERLINDAIRAAVERTINAGGMSTAAAGNVSEEPTTRRFENNASTSLVPPSSEHHYWGNTFGSIPDFDPVVSPHQTIETWIRKIEQAAATYGWTDRVTVNVALPKLKGVARTWYEGLTTTTHSWSEWKELLREWFPTTKSSQKLHHEMEQRIRLPGENVETYFHEKMAKGRLCGLSDGAMIDYLITGLADEKLVMALSTRDYDSPQQLLRFVKQMEERLEFTKGNGTSKGRFHARSELLKPLASPKVEISQAKIASNPSNRRRRPAINEKGEYLCFNCSDYGHLSKDCPKPQRRERCTVCQRIGHRASDCRYKLSRTDGDNHRPTISHLDDTQEGTDTNEKYFMEAEIDGVAVKAYIDLGSKCVTVRSSTARDLKLTYEPVPPGCVIRGFGRGCVKPLGRTMAEIKVDQVQAKVDVYVVPDAIQAIPLLVGQPVTEGPNVTVLKRNNVLRLFQENREHEDEECIRNIQIPELPPLSANLWAKEATVIPPNYVGFVDVHTSSDHMRNSEILVEAQMRFPEGQIYCIPRNVTTIDSRGNAAIPIANISQREMLVPKGQRIVRAELCEGLEEHIPSEDVRKERTIREPLSVENLKVGPSVTEDEKIRLLTLLNKYRDCFAENIFELGRTHLAKMKIELTSDKPVTFRPYRLSYAERDLVKDKISSLMAVGIVSESNSPYASPMLIVKKKSGEERLCIDYRALNKITKRDAFPLPLIDDQLERLAGKKVFTSLDLASGYYQVPVDRASREKTAFVTPDGHYEFNNMPFGLTNAPAVFQRLINMVLGPLRYSIAMAYMDDILIPSPDIQTGFEHLQQILEVLRAAGLTLNLKKCSFFQDKVDYLGFDISGLGVRPGESKTKCVLNFPQPTNVHEVRRFMGLTSYLRRFVPHFAEIAEPLNCLLRKGVEWKWTGDQERAFQELKQKLSMRPVLGSYDPTAHTEVHADASRIGLGAVLLQRGDDNQMHPICYASRKTTIDEGKYHSYELETLAIVWALEKFRTYLMGRRFVVVTDCNSVRSAFAKKNLVPRIGRWWLKLQEYDFDVEHRPGTKMLHVDALSRSPINGSEDTDIAMGLDVLHCEIDFDDWLMLAQREDPRIQIIKQRLLKESDLSNEDRHAKENYSIEGGKVFKREMSREGEKLLWVVPSCARWRIVKRCHDDIGHFSLDKTLAKIKQDFWFPGMKRYVGRYIASCLQCLYHKQPTGSKPGMLHPIDKVGEPFHTLHIDHLGPFVKSIRGNMHLIVVVDAFTKFTLLRAVRNTEMRYAARFLDEINGIFGAPMRVITDRGTAYTGRLFETLCRETGIIHVKNATATPRGNGQVERYNRTITPSLASMCQREDERDWDERITQVQWGINNTIHSVTKCTPFSLLFNFVSRNPKGDQVAAAVRETFNKEVQQRREQALAAIRRDQEQQRARYNARRRKAEQYEPGDLVLLEREPVATGVPRKTAPKYRGPYIVTRKLRYDRYQIEELPERRRSNRFYCGVAPVDKLKRWTTIDGELDDDPSEIDDE